MVESVEHLDTDLETQFLSEIEPFCRRQILVYVSGCSQIGKVARSITEGEVLRSLKGRRVEKAVFCSNRDGGNPVGAAAGAAFKAGPRQISMLIAAKYGRRVSAGADRHWETALRSGNARHLPAARDCIFNPVHAATELFAPANWQVIHIVQKQRVRDIDRKSAVE